VRNIVMNCMKTSIEFPETGPLYTRFEEYSNSMKLQTRIRISGSLRRFSGSCDSCNSNASHCLTNLQHSIGYASLIHIGLGLNCFRQFQAFVKTEHRNVDIICLRHMVLVEGAVHIVTIRLNTFIIG
jgi:hypothetical protein